MVSRSLPLVVGLAALVLNPFFACTDEPEFTYGAAELRAAIEGTWTLALPASTAGGTSRELTLSIEQAAEAGAPQAASLDLVRPASACGTRSLVRPAAACIDMTEMPLVVQVTEVSAGTVASTGVFRVMGLSFTDGELEVALSAGATVHARVSPAGEASEVKSYEAGGSVAGTLVRVSPVPTP